MALSTELISQFAKIVAPKEQRPESTTVTGTAKEYAGKIYVQIDGSDQLTPIASSTVGMKDGDKVTVQIKNHSATITGNASDPSAGKSYADDINNKVDDVSDQISEFEIIIADKVDVDDLNAVNGRIDNLVSENVTITGKLDAVEADIGNLTADNVTINGKLDAADAEIENLKVTKLDVDIADMKYATIENLEATNADIHNLKADYGEFKDLTTEKFTAVDADIADLDATKLSAEQADLKYANIDFANIGKAAIENFFSKSGMIGDLVVGDGTITGTLVGVTIKGDLIEGGTVKADKLVVQGEDGLYYKLNVTGETVAAEQTEYNSLNGSIITAQSITAEKISVNDLVAFGATIGGFHITDSSLYSGVKESATNTTRGVFMNDEGEFSVGDSNNYFRYFYDTESSTYKLEISAAQIKLGTTDKTLDETLSDMQDQINNVDVNVSVGGRNLIRNSKTLIFTDYVLSNSKYSITTMSQPSDGGTIEVTPEQAAEGESVTATFTPSGTNVFQGGFVYDSDTMSNEEPTVVAQIEDSPFTFDMPDCDITVVGQFGAPTYTIEYVNVGVGSFEGPDEAAAGASVTFTVKPSALMNATTDKITVETTSGSMVYSDTDLGTGNKEITFVMPSENVTVTAEFGI